MVIALRPFQRRFIASALAPGIDTAALSLPRGNGKSWLGGHLVADSLTPESALFVEGAENILVASSLEQARTVFRFARAALGESGYRYLDSYTRIGITHRPTNTRLRVLSSDSKRALGIVGARLIVADEPGAWPVIGGEALHDALATAAGKNRMSTVYLGTLAPAPEGWWWPELVKAGDTPGVHVTVLQGERDTWDRWSTIRRCNPLIDVNPILRVRIKRERDDARQDERLKARFLSFRLNLPTKADDCVLLTVDDWQRTLARPVPDRVGRPLVGVDLGAGRAWSAAVAVWRNGRVEARALAPGIPSLSDQEKRDRVPSGTYRALASTGALVVCEGLRVPPISDLLEILIPWRPERVICDRFRLPELRDAMRSRIPIEARRTRWSESSFDIRALRKLAKDGPLAVEQRARGLLTASLSAATVRPDDAGSVRLIKKSDNRARDDVAEALKLGAGAVVRSPSVERREVGLVVVG